MIVMVGIMAAAISTVDSIILTLSSLIARDVYAGSDEKRQLLVGKLVIPVIAVLALIFAWQQFDLIAVLSVSASAGLLVIVPSLIGTFFWSRGTKEGALASVIVGGLLVILFELKDITLLGQGTAVWALIVSVLLFVGISLMTKPPAKAETFLTELKDELAKKGAV